MSISALRSQPVVQHLIVIGCLVVIYFLLYAGNIFAYVRSAELMGVDPRSIIGSIHALFEDPVYNLHGAYHSRVYGWTYFVINFFVVAPFKLLGASELVMNIVFRMTLFVIGLILILAFYGVAYRFVGKLFGAFAVVLLMINPVAGFFFLEIHPETTGVMFYLLALYFLIKFASEGQTLRTYAIAVVFLALSALSKQPFAIISFFIFLCFPYLRLQSLGCSLKEYLKTTEFRKLFLLTIALVFGVTFIVHPYAILRFDQLLYYQLRPLSHSRGDVSSIVGPWAAQVYSNPIVLMNFSLLLLLAAYKKLHLPLLFRYSIIVSAFVTVLFMYMQKQFIIVNYLFPLFPIYVLNIVFAVKTVFEVVIKPRGKLVSSAVIVITTAYFSFVFAQNLSQTVYYSYKRIYLDGLTTKDLSWVYIQGLPEKARILYMPTVAMPPEYKETSCHVWRACNKLDGLTEFDPEYILVSWDFRYFNKDLYKQFVASNNYRQIHEIKPEASAPLNCKKDSAKNLRALLTNYAPGTLGRGIDHCLEKLANVREINREAKITGSAIQVYTREAT